MRPFLLHGLNQQDSECALWNLMFSPALRSQFGEEWSWDWCQALIRSFAAGDQDAVSRQYQEMRARIAREGSPLPRLSMANPPWSMISLDLVLGCFPWATPCFERALLLLLERGAVCERRSGDVLPIAFVLSGGPGDDCGTALRLCAPSGVVRASAEHWLMRALLDRQQSGGHATMRSRDSSRQFSVHVYRDRSGERKRVYFETTESFGRENEDFADFLKNSRTSHSYTGNRL